MDRIIKFRGVAVSSGEMVYGCLIKKRYTAFADWMIEDENGLGSDVVTETIGQFTGLKDKNGKEIFEGDIVKCLTATIPEDKGFVCQFKDYRWKFYNINFPDDDFYGTVNYNYIQQNCEIIGNIHQNEELIK
jgi:uncharacterized phage protein (TIGR01671 family)